MRRMGTLQICCLVLFAALALAPVAKAETIGTSQVIHTAAGDVTIRTYQAKGKTYIAVPKGGPDLPLYDGAGNLLGTIKAGTAFMFSGADASFANGKVTLSNIRSTDFRLAVSTGSANSVSITLKGRLATITAQPGATSTTLEGGRSPVGLLYWHSRLMNGADSDNGFTEDDDRTLISLSN